MVGVWFVVHTPLHGVPLFFAFLFFFFFPPPFCDEHMQCEPGLSGSDQYIDCGGKSRWRHGRRWGEQDFGRSLFAFF